MYSLLPSVWQLRTGRAAALLMWSLASWALSVPQLDPSAALSAGAEPVGDRGGSDAPHRQVTKGHARLPQGVQPEAANASKETRQLYKSLLYRGILVEADTDATEEEAEHNPNRLLLDGKVKFSKPALASKEMILSADRIRNITGPQGCEPDKRVAICAIMKNAAPTLPQWLVWHRLLGVGSFHIFDDDSTDNTPEVVGPWVEAGVLTHEPAPFPGNESIQMVAYASCLKQFGGTHDWVGFIDADELMQPMNNRAVCLPSFLNRTNFAKAGSVGFSWLAFGSGDDYILTMEPPARHHAQEPLTLWDLNDFDAAQVELPAVPGVKSFCRPSLSTGAFATPHYCLLKKGALQLSENAHAFTGSANVDAPTNAHMQVAHFRSGSLQYWIEKKIRGRAGVGTAGATTQKEQGTFGYTFDLATLVDEWKEEATKRTRSEPGAHPTQTEPSRWRATLRQLNQALKDSFNVEAAETTAARDTALWGLAGHLRPRFETQAA